MLMCRVLVRCMRLCVCMMTELPPNCMYVCIVSKNINIKVEGGYGRRG